jgi:hypothetical protein
VNTNIQDGIIKSVVPPGGWHYPQKLSSGQTVRLTAPSCEMLVETMVDFRRRNLGLCAAEDANSEAAIRDLKIYLCNNFRQNCADSRSAPKNQTGIGVLDYRTPINKAGNWLGAIQHERLQYVDLGTAGHRAQICVQCAQNVRWQTGCAPCNENIEVRVQNIKGNMRTPYDRQLHLCRVFGHINEVAVWLDDTRSSSEQKPPPHCWVAQQ